MATSSALTVESLCNRLQRSRLVKVQQIRSIYQQWRRVEPRATPREADRFAKWLVANHYLTSYQVQQLVTGRSDFFVNHYQLLSVIGGGKMAGVYKAAHQSGHIVAVKLMPPAKSEDPQLVARFRREARMAVRLKDEHVVRTFHMGMAGSRPYIVMEYLEGETLEDLLKRRKKLPHGEAARLIHQALIGLLAVQAENMVHRDLKPGNLMVVPPRPPGAPDNTLQQTLKIFDIGMGRFLFEEGMADPEQMCLTTDGMMIGSPEYMSPEQAKDPRNVDIRTDIYSLGCVLYHLLSGQAPFGDRNMVLQIVAHAREKPKPIAGIPDGLQSVLEYMMAKDPDNRYETPAAAAQAIQPFVGAQKEVLPEAEMLGKSYYEWVEAQPADEVSAAPAVTDRWLYRHGGRTCGPVATAMLDQLASTGGLSPDDPLWMEGDDPALALHARAALYFPATLPVRRAVAVPANAPSPAEMGFNPETGQIIDHGRYTKWLREQKEKKARAVAKGLTVQEAYTRARNDLSNWVDLDKNRQLILTGDMDAIRNDPAIKTFMLAHLKYGQEVLHKLWTYLEFITENRRKYYFAFAR